MQVESFPYQPSGLGNFVLDQSLLNYVSTGMLADVIPSYPYLEYSDDSDVQAFFSTYNNLAQGYVNWFNSTPLGLYTSPNITGQLLDWTAQGIYGIARPVISSLQTRTVGAVNSFPANTLPANTLKLLRSGNAQEASDDVYKRTLTWILFKGDGLQASVTWLRKRIARFIYGANGSDVPLSDAINVGIVQPTLPATGSLGTVPLNTRALNTRLVRNQKAAHTLQIVLPSSTIATQFANLLQQGYLPVPFQVSLTVQLT